jgi:hypothetical protein
MKYRAYLQGSYANATNIRGNSDVDLVVEATSVSYSNLTSDEKVALGLGKGSYGWSRFRTEVIAALTDYYAAAVDSSGSRAIKLMSGSNRLAADVVPAVKYKRYKDLKVQVEGITFWSNAGQSEQIINYPKKHIEYGAAKNGPDRTNGWYKRTVRVFKNARENLIEGDELLRKRYPSYFIECLLYNAPDASYGDSFHATFVSVVNNLQEQLADEDSQLVCQNRHQWLFGDSSVTWTRKDAIAFISALTSLWNHW